MGIAGLQLYAPKEQMVSLKSPVWSQTRTGIWDILKLKREKERLRCSYLMAFTEGHRGTSVILNEWLVPWLKLVLIIYYCNKVSSKYLSIWTQRPCDAVCSVAINSYFSWLMTFSSSLNTFIAQIKGKCYFDTTHSVTQTGSNSFAKSNVSFYSTASQLLSVWWTFPCQPSS